MVMVFTGIAGPFWICATTVTVPAVVPIKIAGLGIENVAEVWFAGIENGKERPPVTNCSISSHTPGHAVATFGENVRTREPDIGCEAGAATRRSNGICCVGVAVSGNPAAVRLMFRTLSSTGNVVVPPAGSADWNTIEPV